MDWFDPMARARLIETVGVSEYNRLHAEFQRQSILKTVNGYPIRPVGTMFGRLFAVGGTKMAFATLEQAEAHAKALKTRPVH